MYKVSALAAAFILALAGCASQPGGVGSSRAAPAADTWNSPIPEQPGYNRWRVPAPPD